MPRHTKRRQTGTTVSEVIGGVLGGLGIIAIGVLAVAIGIYTVMIR